MKVALVHEHLAQDGGAEKVLRSLQQLYPEAPTYTLLYDAQHAHPDFRKKDIRTSYLQRRPFGVRMYRWYLNEMPTAIESFDLSGYDVVISSASAFAKGVLTLPQTMHVSYCHSPTRYLWTDTYDYIRALPYNRIIKSFIPRALTRLRQWDRLAADRVDYFIANSRIVQDRIKKYYRRSSDIIYPPVELDHFSISSTVGNYYLIGGRLVPYKRFDIAVEAFNRIGLPLKVFGTGPEFDRLRDRAKKNVEFLGRVSDEEMAQLYRECIAFINPQEEDFGITAIEAMASGRPVIAYAAGGALETVVDGLSGSFFVDQEWESLSDKIIRFKPEIFNPQQIRAHAERFSDPVFKKNISSFVTARWADFHKHSSVY